MDSAVVISVKRLGDGDCAKDDEIPSISKERGFEESCAGTFEKDTKRLILHSSKDDGGQYGNSHADRRKQRNGFVDDVTEGDQALGDCGFGAFNPKSMQRFKTIGWFTGIYGLTGIMTSALVIYISSQITTLERQFNFSSSTSGFLMSCNDIGYFLTCLILSYMARRVHIPKGLAVSSILFGISGLICTIPYFGTKDQLRSISLSVINNVSATAPSQMCDRDNHVTNFQMTSISLDDDNDTTTISGNDSHVSANGGIYGISDEWSMMAVAIIAVGMILQGAAKSPRQSFVTIYIDDNVPKSKTSFYLGIIVSMGIFGPSLAFILGGLFSSLYITLEDTQLNIRDPRFLGAWWLGFLVFGSVSLVVGIPLLCFPRKLRIKQDIENVERMRKANCEGKNKLLHEIKSFLKTTLALFGNPLFMLLVLSVGVKMISLSGAIAFFPKYLESHFNMPAWEVNIAFGALKVIGASVGSLLGGIITSRNKMSPHTCLRMILGINILTIATQLSGFFIICDQPKVNSGPDDVESNQSQCVTNCHCNMDSYFPVCGDDGQNYFSPCHAGCSDVVDGGNARGGLCEDSCEANFWIYITMIFFVSLGSAVAIMPTFIACIRSVPEAQKPMALGIKSFTAALIGWFPGPILFGYVIDTTCLIWQTSSSYSKNAKGACLLHNLASFRNKFHGLITGLQVCSMVLVMCAILYATLSSKDVFLPHKDDDEDDKEITPNSPTEKMQKLK